MIFKWWSRKPAYSVCSVCGVHFDVDEYDAQWGPLCAEHRKPVRELTLRRRRVMAWADTHWARLEVQMKAEEEKERAEWQANHANEKANRYNSCMAMAMAQQQSASQSSMAAGGAIQQQMAARNIGKDTP